MLEEKHVRQLYEVKGTIQEVIDQEQLFTTREYLISALEAVGMAADYVEAEVEERATGLKA